MKSRPWFQRLLSTYLPIFYFIIVFLIFVFFMTINNVLDRQMSRTNNNYAKYVMQTLESSLQNIDRIVYREVDNNEDFQRFLFHRSESDMNEHILNSRLSTKFNDLKVNFPLIDSIYFYRKSDSKVLSSSAMLSLESFGDQAFVKGLMNNQVPYTWTGVRPYKLFADDPIAYPVVSLVKKVPFRLEPEGFLIINVSVSALEKMLQEMNTQNISYTAVNDRNGVPIITYERSQLGEISRFKSNYLEWEILTGLKSNYNYSIVSDFYYGWLILGAVAILIGTLAIIFLTKKYMSPVDRILSRIAQYSKSRSKELPEIMNSNPRFVETAIDQLIELANQYNDIHKENMLHRKKQFFIELVGGEHTEDFAIKQRDMREFGLPEAFHKVYISITEIDKYASFCEKYSYRDQYLLKFVIASVVKETAAELDVQVWSEWLENERLTTLFFIGDSGVDKNELLNLICERTRLWTKQNLDYTVSIGIGSGVTQLEAAAQSFDEAEKALTYKTAVGENISIPYWETQSNFQMEAFEYMESIQSIADSFKLHKEDWLDSFNQMMNVLKQKYYLRQDIMNLLNYMVFHISKEIWELPSSYKEIWDQTAFKLNHVMKEFNTIDDLHEQFVSLLVTTFEQMGKLRLSKSNQELIQNVKRYIEENASNPNLSLGLLSDQFQTNLSYLSRMFKDEFGENFVDYLARIRIMSAKELLQHTNYSIQEVAGKVGYLHYFSFNRVFKKNVGMTPGEYRKQSG